MERRQVFNLALERLSPEPDQSVADLRNELAAKIDDIRQEVRHIGQGFPQESELEWRYETHIKLMSQQIEELTKRLDALKTLTRWDIVVVLGVISGIVAAISGLVAAVFGIAIYLAP